MQIAREIESHHDAEMQWIVDETRIAAFAGGGRVSRGDFVKQIGACVGRVMISRLGDLGRGTPPLHVREFENVAWESMMTMERKPDHHAGDTAAHVVPMCIAYACLRAAGLSLGCPDPTPGADYWPFGQEGGFCNPMKLKMMGDSD